MNNRFRVPSLAVALLALVGCASSGQEPAPTAAPVPSVTAETGPSLDITIAGGTVTPTNAEMQARVGVPITLVVTSDAPDELHVHAVPEHIFAVEPVAGQVVSFTVDVPGRVEVELHDLHRTVVTIQVRP